MKLNSTYLVFVPPGWLLAGTVSSEDSDSVTLSNAVYLESPPSGVALPAAVPSARSASALKASVSSSYATEPVRILRAHVVLAWECRRDMTPLIDSEAREALK